MTAVTIIAVIFLLSTTILYFFKYFLFWLITKVISADKGCNFKKRLLYVNSLKRKSTDYSTPIELFYAFFGREILDKLNISLIEPNSVILSPELLK